MASMLYIHGFNSSPESSKAQTTATWLARQHPKIAFVCPFLSPFPQHAMAALEGAMAAITAAPVWLVGSSMGGFYATWLAEKYRCRAVVINPAVAPWRGADHLLGEQTNYHSGEKCRFTQAHLDQLRDYAVPALAHPENIWALVQTGDEVLDYRQAVAYYQGCRVTVEAGGDHGFQGYARFLPAMMDFFTRGPHASTSSIIQPLHAPR